MKEAVRRLNDEYQFNLTEKEIDVVAQQAEEAALLFKPLFEVNVDGITPLTVIEKRVRKIPTAKKGQK
jgi:Asp-tRNA(Asn)/Glu-tRNA(Gln) amidotransferase C subunit